MFRFSKFAALAVVTALLSVAAPAAAQSTGGSGGDTSGAGSASSGGSSTGGSTTGGSTSGGSTSGESPMDGAHGPQGSTLSTPSSGAMLPVSTRGGKARFSDAPAYLGQPNLALTLAMIDAGGGPNAFKTQRLLGALAGESTQAETDSLTKKFGTDGVASFINVFNFVVSDALKQVAAAGVALPSKPQPNPSDGKALAAALYSAGRNPQTGIYNVEFMLDDLVTHPIHVQVMKDIDAKFGPKADANYHVILQQAMLDLKSVYSL